VINAPVDSLWVRENEERLKTHELCIIGYAFLRLRGETTQMLYCYSAVLVVSVIVHYLSHAKNFD